MLHTIYLILISNFMQDLHEKQLIVTDMMYLLKY